MDFPAFKGDAGTLARGMVATLAADITAESMRFFRVGMGDA